MSIVRHEDDLELDSSIVGADVEVTIIVDRFHMVVIGERVKDARVSDLVLAGRSGDANLHAGIMRHTNREVKLLA